MTTATGSPSVEDVPALDPCLVPARLGALILGHCTQLQGHEGPHSAPLDRVTWEQSAAAGGSLHIGDLTAEQYAQTIESRLANSICARLAASFQRTDISDDDAFAIVRGRYLETENQAALRWKDAQLVSRREVPGGVDIEFRVPLAKAAEVE